MVDVAANAEAIVEIGEGASLTSTSSESASSSEKYDDNWLPLACRLKEIHCPSRTTM